MTELSYYQKIIFKGNEYILVAGGITTKEDFENGRISYAHLYPDGIIKRHTEIIGTKDDIIFTDEFIEATPNLDGFFEGLFGDSWTR